MRVWLQKQKKKDETKAATPQVVTPPVEPTPTPADGQPQGEAAGTPVETTEGAPKSDGAAAEGDVATGEHGGDTNADRAVSQSQEVSPMCQSPISDTIANLTRIHMLLKTTRLNDAAASIHRPRTPVTKRQRRP